MDAAIVNLADRNHYRVWFASSSGVAVLCLFVLVGPGPQSTPALSAAHFWRGNAPRRDSDRYGCRVERWLPWFKRNCQRIVALLEIGQQRCSGR